MRKIFILLSAIIMATACSDHKPGKGETEPESKAIALPGDSTVYGLACEGCTDSIIVFMNLNGDDPDTIDILRAMLSRKVIGRPQIGDNLAVMLNPENKREALSVINVDRLKATWAYLVMPTLRHRAGTADQHDSMPPVPDSIMKRIMVPHEYGFTLKRNNAAQPLIPATSSTQSNGQSPVQYPRQHFYTEWHLYNGKLILTQEARDSAHQSVSDTAEIVSLRRDTLKLRFGDETKTYYRKQPKAE